MCHASATTLTRSPLRQLTSTIAGCISVGRVTLRECEYVLDVIDMAGAFPGGGERRSRSVGDGIGRRPRARLEFGSEDAEGRELNVETVTKGETCSSRRCWSGVHAVGAMLKTT